MGIKRVLGLAGLMLAGGMLSGCWGDGCWCGGSKTTRPPANQTPAVSNNSQTPSTGWANQTRSQDLLNNATPAGTGLPLGANTTTNVPAASALTTPSNGSMNAGTPAASNSVRTVGGLSAGDGMSGSVTPPVTPASVTQRDTFVPSTNVSAPPPPSLPPPPPTLPATKPAGGSTSNYLTVPPAPPPTQGQALPPETIPGQSSIPTLRPGGSSPVE